MKTRVRRARWDGKREVDLRRRRRRVTLLVRSGELAEGMSRYLIRRIEQNPTILLRTRSEALEGGDHLERVPPPGD